MGLNIFSKSYVFALVAILFFVITFLPAFAINKSWSIIQSNEETLILKYTPSFNGFKTFKATDGRLFYIPVISGVSMTANEPGDPLALYATENITIPFPDGFHLDDVNVKSFNSYKQTMLPKGLINLESEVPETDYIYDESKYENYKMPDWVSLTYSGIARDRYIASLKITASRYNPETKCIEIPSEITVKIRFPRTSLAFSTNSEKDVDLVSSINHFDTFNWVIPPKKSKENKNNNDKILSEQGLPWLKITIDKEGIYRLSADKLTSLGFKVPINLVNTIKLMGNGGKELSETVSDASKNEKLNEQAIIVRTNADGSLSEIIFYGAPANGFQYNMENKKFEHYINHYSIYNYYLLTYGGAEGKRAAAITPASGEILNKPNTYIEKVFYEEELNSPFNSPSGRVWFGRTGFPSVFQTSLANIDHTGKLTYQFSLAHRADTNPGTFKVEESGNLIATTSVPASIGKYTNARRIVFSATADASIIATDGRSTLGFSYSNNGNKAATPFFDWYEIQYPRFFVPIEKSIGFFSDPEKEGITEYSINNFSGEIIGFEVSEPDNPMLLTNLSVTGGLFVLRSDEQKDNPKRYFISSNLREPKSIENMDYAGLRENMANKDVIVITHPDFLASANKYASYRNEFSDLSTEVFRIDHIFNEFGSGIPDPTALRDFIAYCFANWEHKPKYVILWGDGHYDYTPRYDVMNNGGRTSYQIVSNSKKNYIPPYESIEKSDVFDATVSYTTDDFFARIVGDDKQIDIAIGRMPIEKVADGDWIYEKIRHYEQNSAIDSWRTVVTLLADDSPTSEGGADRDTHTSQSELLSKEHIPGDIQLKKIYLPEFPTENIPGGRRKPRVTQEILTTTNTSGTLLFNYLGHGNPSVLTHERVFEREKTTPLMTNLDKLFFCTAATCDFGKFDFPDILSGAEELVLSRNGGAIGVFSASRVVYAYQNAALTYKFYDELFKRNPQTGQYPRIGDVSYTVKQQDFDNNDEKFYLLADPTMRLLIPDNIVEIDTINREYSGGKSTIKLEALSSIKLSGNILKADSTTLISDFNGTVIITLRDSKQDMVLLDVDGTNHKMEKPGGALNRSSFKVVNGRFEAEFIIPGDISFSGKNGNLYAFAFNDNGVYAKGNNANVLITGIDTSSINEKNGPDIAIYLDSRKFIEYDVVRNSPLLIVDLQDESGINTTGLGIGHRIEAWLDDNPNSIDLTDKFVTSLDNPKAGTIEDYLEKLLPGTHKIKVRAWDVYNNYSIKETFFTIKPDGEFDIYGVMNYPNPAFDKTTFTFQHNLSPPIDVTIKIYTLGGALINTLKSKILSAHSGNIDWNCKGKNNETLPGGPYYYSLELQSVKDSCSSSGSFIIAR